MDKPSKRYELLRSYVRFAFWLTHKRIVVTGKHLIPKGKPIIFAPNHQNALMDPLALVCTNPFQTVWLARADIFKSNFFRPVLKFLKLMPIYRIRDGKDNLQNNDETFTRVSLLLENGQTVALFPEAAHSGKRQMLPHRKAIPRIALETEAKNFFGLGLQIVPVGIYYSHYWAFNRELVVEYGSPIEVTSYREAYRANPKKALLDLRDEIHRKLAPLTLQINSEDHYDDHEDLREMAGEAYSNGRFFSKNRSLQLLYAHKELVGKLEKIEKENPEEFESIIQNKSVYLNHLKKAGLTDKQAITASRTNGKKVLVHLIAVLISLPVFMSGALFNLIPFAVPRIIFKKKIKNRTFLSTFNFVSGLILFPLFYLFSAIMLYIFTGSLTLSFVAFGLIPFAGKAAYLLSGFYRLFFNELCFFAGNETKKKNIIELAQERENLVQQVLERVK